MRIEQLRLERFGFHERRIFDFPAVPAGSPDLHVIFGGNATGKSSARAAISDLLYTIPHITPWAIGYSQTELKIGAIIVDRTGRRLDVTRTKGRKAPLTDTNGTAIEESVLQAFLGGVDRNLYESFYALDQTDLREGGQNMLKARGQIGETIFAAASGLITLSDIKEELQKELDSLGGDRKGTQKPIRQAIDAYTTATERAQEALLRMDDWNSATEALATAEKNLKGLQERRKELEEERTTLDRHSRLLPVLSDLTRLRAELEACKDTRVLPGDFEQRWRNALQEADRAIADLEKAQGVKKQRQVTRSGLPDDAGRLPAFAGEIEALNQLIGQIRTELRDEVKLDRDTAQSTQRLRDMAGGLGASPEGTEDLVARIPPQAVIDRIRNLITEYEGLVTALDLQETTRKTAVSSLETNRDNMAALGVIKDPTEAAARVKAVRTLDADARKLAKDRETLRKAENAEKTRLDALKGWTGTAEGLPAALFPTIRAVSEAKAATEQARRVEDAARQKVENAEADIARLQGEIDGAAAGHGTVPSAEAVAAERANRDSQWVGIRHSTEAGAKPETATLDAYERQVAAADGLVDRQLASADLLASQSIRSGELVRQQRALQHAMQVYESAGERRKTVEDAAAALWTGSGYTGAPQAPDAMLAWLDQKDKAIEAIEARIAKAAEVEESQRKFDGGLKVLREAGVLLGVTSPATLHDEKEIEAAVNVVVDALTAAQSRWTTAQQLERTIREREREFEQADQDWKIANTKLTGWQVRWAAEMPAINLPIEAKVGEARVVIEQWTSFNAEVVNRTQLERRANGIRDNLSARRAEIDALLTKIGDAGLASIENAPTPEHWHDWPGALYTALNYAKSKVEAIAAADRELGAAVDEALKAEETATACQNALQRLRNAIGLGESDDVEHAMGGSTAKRKLSDAIEDRLRALAEISDGTPEAQLYQELHGGTKQALQNRQTENEQERETIHADIQVAVEHRTQCKGKVAELEKRTGYAVANYAAMTHAAELGELMRKSMRIKAAIALLDATIKEYRDRHEGSMIKRANEIFIDVAGKQAPDFFLKLEVDYTKPTDPQLIAVRKSGSAAHVGELSEGTRDQLWLALRIATLERRARKIEPMPFLADDLFASSDAIRAETGMRYLAELAKSNQVILFAHHEYVAEAARSVVQGVNVQVLERAAAA